MSLTRAEAQALGRRAAQPVKGPGEMLALWCPGKLVNAKNQSRGWQMKAWGRYKREWKERVAQALLETGWRRGLHGPPTPLIYTTKLNIVGGGFVGDYVIGGSQPKRVVFQARTHLKMDSDGLALSLAPVRDALIEGGVIHNDHPDSGHAFVYDPCVIDRAHRGVTVRVSLL